MRRGPGRTIPASLYRPQSRLQFTFCNVQWRRNPQEPVADIRATAQRERIRFVHHHHHRHAGAESGHGEPLVPAFPLHADRPGASLNQRFSRHPARSLVGPFFQSTAPNSMLAVGNSLPYDDLRSEDGPMGCRVFLSFGEDEWPDNVLKTGLVRWRQQPIRHVGY